MRLRTLITVASVTVLLGLMLASQASAQSTAPVRGQATVAAADDEVVLPSRVANAITRAQNLLDDAGVAVDTRDSVKAVALLKALQAAITRADNAARTQMNAVPADPEADGATSGPDSVVAVLTLDQTIITTLAGLFDGTTGAYVDASTHALFAAMNTRDKLLNAVIALPAEGAGADYADGMADTVLGYDDEVANITEAIATDKLSAGGKKVLQSALAQSQRTDASVNAAFGGGE
jgi:hypothetical protein